ncbi:hypothetical protein ACJW31_03G050300 [Castanea mollissima]
MISSDLFSFKPISFNLNSMLSSLNSSSLNLSSIFFSLNSNTSFHSSNSFQLSFFKLSNSLFQVRLFQLKFLRTLSQSFLFRLETSRQLPNPLLSEFKLFEPLLFGLEPLHLFLEKTTRRIEVVFQILPLKREQKERRRKAVDLLQRFPQSLLLHLRRFQFARDFPHYKTQLSTENLTIISICIHMCMYVALYNVKDKQREKEGK